MNRLCEERASIQREAAGAGDDWGNPTGGFATASSTRCRKVQLRAAEQVQVGATVEIAQYALLFPSGTDVQGGDVVVIGSSRYAVLGVNGDPGSRGVMVRALVREVVREVGS